ncbi:lipid-A-disaccharide synthase [Gilvimarinus xylanilyticus]|uniref:Lipid-A-disaccharide synthase n=1 Tax=Gilvimarinus xylanilyticus TaxID=2944139 RepID=A0A9X2HUS8_9GAMM|nr:lipid-A-disaccharide synthase [Gilvimarinus xylanilyticus]MCP8898600.1 lipid-A-disaccharide synthase [Gilvimarinus xylanilyticus]
MHRPVRIGIVVGEASGDILGAGLIHALKSLYPHVEFSGIGGPLMLEQGFHSFFPQERLAVMGLIEPLKRLPELLRIRKFLKQHFSEQPPDAFIGIDAPDFNLALEAHLRANGVKTVHYVSPSVWAWRSGRIKTIRRAVDLMLTLLPFETDIYAQHQVPARFVGHPLADKIPLETDVNAARAALNIDAGGPVIALLPGSRQSEVERLGPVFWRAARQIHEHKPGTKFLVPAANGHRYRQLHQQLSEFTDLPIKLINGLSHEVMAASDLVVLASGTTALEAMLLKKPMIVTYRMASLSFRIMKAMATVSYVSLPNLLADKALVPELLQGDASAENIYREVVNYLESPEKVASLQDQFLSLHQQLRCDANREAARAVAELIDG